MKIVTGKRQTGKSTEAYWELVDSIGKLEEGNKVIYITSVQTGIKLVTDKLKRLNIDYKDKVEFLTVSSLGHSTYVGLKTSKIIVDSDYLLPTLFREIFGRDVKEFSLYGDYEVLNLNTPKKEVYESNQISDNII